MRQLICGTGNLFLFLFLFIFGHAVLTIKDKVCPLTHSLYRVYTVNSQSIQSKTESIQFIHLLYMDYVQLHGRPPKKEKEKEKRKNNYLNFPFFLSCNYYYVKLLSFTKHLYFSSFFRIILNIFISSLSIALNKLMLVFFAGTFYKYLFNLCFINNVNRKEITL